MVRSYKWQPHDEGRHAIPQELGVNDVGHTLCGIELTAGPDRWPNEARYWPTCNECDLTWRESEGILPWPRKGRDGGPLSSRRPGTSTAPKTDSPIDVVELVIDTLIAQGAHLQEPR
ncbi:zinc finger protein [Lentzea xinjiangensis]|uniref:zinc finger protein n=1 Tax=Lentzea xinjiangensis TaxID=402600 RepID=UPI000B7E99C3|nr:zinc finger protein [Lentzea xinjiangensis]